VAHPREQAELRRVRTKLYRLQQANKTLKQARGAGSERARCSSLLGRGARVWGAAACAAGWAGDGAWVRGRCSRKTGCSGASSTSASTGDGGVLSRARGGLGSTSVARVTFWRWRRAAGRPSAPPAAIFQPPFCAPSVPPSYLGAFRGLSAPGGRLGAVRNARSYLSKPRARASKEGLQIWGPLQTGQTGQRARTGVFSGQRA